ncbi:MAG: DEAD/DEAH box helicase, partial [Segatella copri]
PQQGNKQQNAKQQPQQGNKQQNAKQQNRKPAQPGEQPKNSNSQKRRNNSNNSNQQRPGTENNIRPGSNGRGRGVAQKKGDKSAAHKHTPIVNPQKQENAVKKFIKRIFGFKK